MFKNSKKHLEETRWGYWYHLRHSFKQSNRLILIALKSYVHGIWPAVFKADGPIEIIKIYHQIKKIHHIWQMENDMKKKGELDE